MASNDPIGDMIARIKNAAQRGRSKVVTPASKLRQRVLDVSGKRQFLVVDRDGFGGVLLSFRPRGRAGHVNLAH